MLRIKWVNIFLLFKNIHFSFDGRITGNVRLLDLIIAFCSSLLCIAKDNTQILSIKNYMHIRSSISFVSVECMTSVLSVNNSLISSLTGLGAI